MKTNPTGKQRLVFMAAILCGVLLLACPVSALTVAGGAARLRPATSIVIDDVQVPLAGGANVLTPSSPGTVTYTGGSATVDASNTGEGYVMVKYSGGGKAKVRLAASGKTTYTYNLRTDGKYEVFPLTSGNGTYQVTVFKNISGNQYAQELAQNINVKLSDSKRPFLYPSQFVNFSAKSKAVAKSTELASGAADDLAVIASVYNYVVGNITYDNDKAARVMAGEMNGYVPDVDGVLAAKKGICFDYAALMAAMLRAQQIPTRMEFGYVSNGVYHAWISTFVKDIGWVNGVIQFDGKNWKLMDPTFAASSGANPQYVGSGVSYKTQYLY